MKKIGIALCVLLLGGLMILGAVWTFAKPGGGGSTQIAPDVVNAGEPTVIKLELTVWGAGGSIKGRYTDVYLHYRLVGETTYKKVQPKLVSQYETQEIYDLTIPSYPKGTSGEIEFYFELKLDGHVNQIEGLKKIKLRP
jgi:hypothetical protein